MPEAQKFSTRVTGMCGRRSAIGERHAGLADVLLLDRGREPGGVDLVLVDAGVGERLLEGLDHQVVGLLVPALAELRAAHAEDGDLVLDASGHSSLPRFRHCERSEAIHPLTNRMDGLLRRPRLAMTAIALAMRAFNACNSFAAAGVAFQK